MKTKLFGKISTTLMMSLTLILFGAAMSFAQTPTLRANGKIAFTSDRDGNSEIYLMNADGTISFNPRESKTDLVLWQVGVTFSIPRSSGR